jgi:hypothetical protein
MKCDRCNKEAIYIYPIYRGDDIEGYSELAILDKNVPARCELHKIKSRHIS